MHFLFPTSICARPTHCQPTAASSNTFALSHTSPNYREPQTAHCQPCRLTHTMAPPLRVKSYSAAWLSTDAPGHQLFEASNDSLQHRGLSRPGSNKKDAAPGPRRTIAKRGTEVFVAAGKEIRWGDLAYIKEQWSAGASRGRSGPGGVKIKREESWNSVEDSVEDSPAGMRVSHIYTALTKKLLTSMADLEDKVRRRHSTIGHLPQRKLPRHPYHPYRAYLHYTRLFAPYEPRYRTTQA